MRTSVYRLHVSISVLLSSTRPYKDAKNTGIDSLEDLALHPAALNNEEGVIHVHLCFTRPHLGPLIVHTSLPTSVYRPHVHTLVEISSHY
jgi:hypothetical protein